jgi:hypothetical protein
MKSEFEDEIGSPNSEVRFCHSACRTSELNAFARPPGQLFSVEYQILGDFLSRDILAYRGRL